MGLKPRVVIDISTDHLKVVLGVERGTPGCRIAACLVREIGGLADDAIAARLKEMLRCLKAPRGAEITGIVPRQHAIVRYLDLPSFDREEIARMVELQAFPQVPYTRAEAVVDFIIMARGSVSSRVMVIIVPRDIFMRYWAIYAKAGIAPDCVTLSSIGMASWAALPPWDAHVNALLDVDEATAEICICEGGALLTSRQISLPAHETGEQRAIDLVRQLELTFTGYEKDRLGPAVGKTLIMASPEMTGHIVHEGRSGLRYVSEAVRFMDNVPVAKTLVWPAVVIEGRVSVVAACGLALAAVKPAVQLLAQDIRATQDRRVLTGRAVRAGLFLVFALAMSAWAVSVPLLQKNDALEVLNAELRELKTKASEVQARADQIEALEGVMGHRIMFSGVIRELYGLIPPGLILSTFSMATDRRMSIEGYSEDRDMVDAFQKAMGQAKSFKDVKLEFINKKVIQVGEVNFFKITSLMADAYETAH